MAPYRTPGPDGGSEDGTGGAVGYNDSAEPDVECKDHISWELQDACSLPDLPGASADLSAAQRKAQAWLQRNLSAFLVAEDTWRVDRRAIAGAIVFEALEDVQGNTRHKIAQRSFGPGKVHVSNWYSWVYERSTVVEQVLQAGYLDSAKITKDNLRDKLATTDGAITCIAAIMRADADVVTNIGGWPATQTYWNPAILGAWFHGKKLFDLVRIYKSKKYAPNSPPLDPGEIKMGMWIRDNLDYLTLAVGKPTDAMIRAPIPPIKGVGDVIKLTDQDDAIEEAANQARINAMSGMMGT